LHISRLVVVDAQQSLLPAQLAADVLHVCPPMSRQVLVDGLHMRFAPHSPVLPGVHGEPYTPLPHVPGFPLHVRPVVQQSSADAQLPAAVLHALPFASWQRLPVVSQKSPVAQLFVAQLPPYPSRHVSVAESHLKPVAQRGVVGAAVPHDVR